MALLQTGQVFKILAPEKVIPKPTVAFGGVYDSKHDFTVDSNGDNDKVLTTAKGLWVVTGTEMSGGDTGHGPYDGGGHGVKAVRVDEDGQATGETIFFCQLGGFNNMLEEDEVQVVGTVTGRRYNLTLIE